MAVKLELELENANAISERHLLGGWLHTPHPF